MKSYLQLLKSYLKLLVEELPEVIEEIPEVEHVLIRHSLVVKADQKLSVEEVREYIRRRCPSAEIDIDDVRPGYFR